MDRLAPHLRMAQADGVDRGVANVNFEQKDSIASSSAFHNDLVQASNDGQGGAFGTSTALQNVPATVTSKTNAPAETNGEGGGGGGGGGAGPGAGSASSSAVSNATSGITSATATEISTATASSIPETTHKSGGGGGGIGTGAIVGIVVGVVGGLIIIAIIAFFILRKRRQKKNAAGYHGTETGNTYMVDKETQGRTTDSPNSPYSDENQTRHVPLENVTRDEPPTERGIPRTSTSGSQGRGGSSGAQTPQGVSSNVAHLVEDGMTVDEIRRLEEEERQLDDEIERAARR